jgi:hypothetical protein
MGLPDLQQSHFLLQMVSTEYNILGSELAVQYHPIPSVALLASWSYKQVYTGGFKSADDTTPKHLIKLGGRFKTAGGIIGSLYVFSTSDFWHRMIGNPEGILSPPLNQYMRSQLFFMGRLGYRWQARDWFGLETGLKLIVPYAFSSPHFQTYERGGGETIYGKPYGAMPIIPTAVMYLKGEF